MKWIGLGATVLFVVCFGAAFLASYWFDKNEIPKVVGAGFGALVSAAIALLITGLAQKRDSDKSKADQQRLENAFWVDTWTTLPALCEEYTYWKALSGQAASATAERPRRHDLVVEHMHSMFFEANLASIYRLPSEVQTSLLVAHDNLRIARERVGQVNALLAKLEGNDTPALGSGAISLSPAAFPPTRWISQGTAVTFETSIGGLRSRSSTQQMR